jgi:hypothetical protein
MRSSFQEQYCCYVAAISNYSTADALSQITKLPFPITLHNMLEEMATTVGDESIVSWQPHGKAFRVHLPEVFAKTAMPHYFKQTKYKSFQRQLHLYGFLRIREGLDRDAYFHSMFIRNNKSMSLRMTRQKIKGKKSSNPTNRYTAGDCPDFYSSGTINVGNDHQYQSSLTNALNSDPTILRTCTTTVEKKRWGCSKHGPAALFTASTDSIDRHPDDEEKPSLLNSASFFYPEVASTVPSSSHQRIGCEDSIGLVDWLELVLRWGDEDNNDGQEGFFAGKRFFHVAETENTTIDGSFQLADIGRG